MSEKYLANGIESAQRAIQCEHEKNFKDAIANYISSIEWLSLAVKYEKNPKVVERVSSKIKEYMEHAESLQQSCSTVTSAQTEKVVSVDCVTWDMVIGLESAKEALKEAVVLPVLFPQIFVRELKPWRGILLYGPPGTGKTFLAKACATESKARFFSVSSSDIMSKWLGESEGNVAKLFEDARAQRPSIIFVDEVESLCSERNHGEQDGAARVKTEFLKQMDGIGHDSNDGVLVLGATNLPWTLDSAMLRRFERRVYIPLPDLEARCKMFQNSFCELSPTQLKTLATMTADYNGADIAIAVRDALMERARRVQYATHFKQVGQQGYTPCDAATPGAIALSWQKIPPSQLIPPQVTYENFVASVRKSRSSVKMDTIRQYEKWTNELGSF